ncbi:hypothetical protein ACQVP2_21835 [Methylobacterium aquaticum]|uniref:hypothetical protein n=1 Tax=Methylobacterium aquaticum TaxID=270351 RepID=UPI003D16901B
MATFSGTPIPMVCADLPLALSAGSPDISVWFSSQSATPYRACRFRNGRAAARQLLVHHRLLTLEVETGGLVHRLRQP